MKTMLNTKIDRDLKERAQKVAEDLGLPLSTVINNYIREFVVERRVVFTERFTPNKKTGKMLKQAIKEIKAGKGLSPVFKNMDDAITYLNSK